MNVLIINSEYDPRFSGSTLLLHILLSHPDVAGCGVERFPTVHLDWVGQDVLQGEMQRLADALGISENVTFHGFQTYFSRSGTGG